MSGDRLIVDGYNVLYLHPVYGAMARDDLDAARARLVADLAGLAQGGRHMTVVFDGGGNPYSDGTPHHIGSLSVIFSPKGTTADTVIEGLAQRSRERGERATVITSDAATRLTVRSGTVSVLSSKHFLEDVVGDVAARAEVNRTARRRTHMAERLAPDVRTALARWARGEAPRD